MDFGKNLKRIRVESNLTQMEIAKKLNVSLKTVSHWESNYTEPNLQMLKKIKEILNITYDELFE